jgi:hypothetical protein
MGFISKDYLQKMEALQQRLSLILGSTMLSSEEWGVELVAPPAFLQ